MSGAERTWRSLAAPSALAFAFLVGLGYWQLRRLDWKEALIARIEQRAQAAPAALPAREQWPALQQEDLDYLHVAAQGRFDLAREALVYALAPAGMGQEPGYYVMTPFLLDAGGAVIVNRGFVSPVKAKGDPAFRHQPQGSLVIAGVLRPPQPRNAFTPADISEKGVWFTRDPGKIAAALGVDDAAPFTLDQDPGEPGAADGLLRLAASTADIPNNHLSYAITWFGLAGALAAVFVLFARGKIAPPKN